MEIFRAPRVTLIARPEFLEPEHLRVQWRGDSSPGERLAEFAGRICYMSQHNPAHRSTAEYLENIKKQGHGSVLEHAVYVLLIEGISRSCSHELVRHRAGFGYSQLSQRYVDESHAAFVMPPAVIGDEQLEAEWQRVVADAQAAYVRADAVLRFRDLCRGRLTGSGARRVSQSLRSDVGKKSVLPYCASRRRVVLSTRQRVFDSRTAPAAFFVGGHPRPHAHRSRLQPETGPRELRGRASEYQRRVSRVGRPIHHHRGGAGSRSIRQRDPS